jgi:hypothetical protein
MATSEKRPWAPRRDDDARLKAAWDKGIASGLSETYRSAADIAAAGRATLAKSKT